MGIKRIVAYTIFLSSLILHIAFIALVFTETQPYANIFADIFSSLKDILGYSTYRLSTALFFIIDLMTLYLAFWVITDSDEHAKLAEKNKDSQSELETLKNKEAETAQLLLKEKELTAEKEQKLSEAEDLLSQTKAQLEEKDSELEESKSASERLQSETSELKDKVQNLEAQAETAEQKTAEAEKAAKAAKKETDSLKSKLKKSEEETAEKEEKLKDLLKQLEEAKGEIASMNANQKGGTEAVPPAAYQILYLLQKEGRLIDLLKEDVSDLDDETLGGAVRTIQEDSRKLFEDRLILEPLLDEEEGTTVTIEKADPELFKLSGKVPAEGPYTGELIHKGWRLVKCKLPEMADGWKSNVVAQAEIEIE
ncbi:MAG: DUF2760 domain-containing protein [Candidatus Riflebacteria bacterium]|nr:DUF2760 domain-containing protein [Candidatus Riflebacteria bacterium]